MQEIIIIGGGGHAKVLIELIRLLGQYRITGVLDSQLKTRSTLDGIIVLGGDDLLHELNKKGIENACIGVGSIRDNSKRKMLYEKVKQIGFLVPCLVHPKSMLSEMTEIADGVQVMAGAIIQTNSSIGENTIINTGAIIEHDCKVGNHIQVCPGAVISGGCSIDDGAFIGAGATLIQGVRIGKNAVIAAGSVVLHDVAEGITVKGVPAR